MSESKVKLPEGFGKVSFRSSTGVWTSQKSEILSALKSLKGDNVEGGRIVKKSDVKKILDSVNEKAKTEEQTPHAFNIFAAWVRNGLAAESADGEKVFLAIDYLK